MDKKNRQNLILQLIRTHEIDTQEELVDRLREAGCDVTQATACRDIKELQLVKTAGASKRYRYVQAAHHQAKLVQDKYTNVFKECVVSMQSANNLIVIKTVSGAANSVGAFFDNLSIPELLGSIAGDDCLIGVASDADSAAAIIETLKNYF